MHHLPAVTIYNKGSAGGRGYSLGSSIGGVAMGRAREGCWHRDCMKAKEKNANRFSEGVYGATKNFISWLQFA